MNSKIVSHTRCVNCGVIKNVADLNQRSEGVGTVCIDKAACKARQEQSKQAQLCGSLQQAQDGTNPLTDGEA